MISVLVIRNTDSANWSTTSDFVNMGTPQVFFDPGHDVLDGDVLVDGSTFYLSYKNLSDGRLYVARSTTGAPNSFTTISAGLKQGGAIEAPVLVKSNTSNEVWLWGDSFSPVNGVMYGWSTTDIGGGSWTAMNQRAFTAPISAKHVTITPITAAERTAMIDRWGAPRWNRLKSSNYPGHFVRHAANVAQLDPYPMDPVADQQWRIVPGLADTAGVSFESVNYPGRYLRHYAYNLRLDANDGSTAFKADATFYPTAGLADSTWTSFRSYNFPDRYIRHAGFIQRIPNECRAHEREMKIVAAGWLEQRKAAQDWIVAEVDRLDLYDRHCRLMARIVTRPLAERSFGHDVLQAHFAFDGDFSIGGIFAKRRC
jgi:non-reducing end alpha-L-arabinofuranosidase